MSELNRLRKQAEKIEKIMNEMKSLSDVDLKQKTDEFKLRIQNGESLNKILPEAYAAIGEAAYRTVDMRPYNVQFMGAIVLHEGKIAEAKTGEGKTLVAAMPAYLNALTGEGVHVVTVNDYLAQRDADEIGKIHEFMGLSVGCVTKDTSQEEKKIEYAKDITYVTNTELGFDYLRDNTATLPERRVQRGFHYCIIDEIDSILIDEARTPLIISGDGGKSTKLYTASDELVKMLQEGHATEVSKVDLIAGIRPEEAGDYIVDEEHKDVRLTLNGIKKCESYFGINNLADNANAEIMHNIMAALKAHCLMKKDKDYVVKNNEVLIVDYFTGRIQPGRRFSDGLHQAIEAKEHVPVRNESATFASVTYQNFFNKYEKKCGMTGTAYTERKEFKSIYDMKVVKIPTNKPVIREDHEDKLYLSRREKFDAVVKEIKETHETGQPVLVGTASVNDSELLHEMLQKENIPHTVLNAKFLDKEAAIIAKAGTFGAVTVATNMAGRGTDIVLDVKAKRAGGLKVIGTQRHESIRIDNQLKGRAGRQGDPGESVFYISLDDEILKIYGPEKTKANFHAMGMNEEGLTNKTVSRFVKKAQTVIEDNNFATRKNVLKYDKVNNEQRELIYEERNTLMNKSDTRKTMLKMISDSITEIINTNSKKKKLLNQEYQKSKKEIENLIFGMEVPEFNKVKNKKDFIEKCKAAAYKRYDQREKEYGNIDNFRDLERQAILTNIDINWMKHLNDLELLKQNISMVGYGQKDPAVVYKIKAFEMFENMSKEIKKDCVYSLFTTQLREKNKIV